MREITKTFMVLITVSILGVSCVTDNAKIANRPYIETNFTIEDPTPVPAVEITRPDEQIFISNNFCSCLNGKPDSLGNCAGFCANTQDTTPTLYVNVTLGDAVQLNELLGNLANWCNVDIGDGNPNPFCQLEVSDGVNIQNLTVNISPNQNLLKADVRNLRMNTPYLARIVEQTSGAASNYFQFSRFIPEDEEPNLGPIKITGINQYACIERSEDFFPNSGDSFYLSAIRTHYYYQDAVLPPVLPPGDKKLFCHDITKYPENDKLEYPRLELIEQSFYLWDETDSRFISVTGPSNLKINSVIQDRLADEYNVIVDSINVFFEFRWPNFPNARQSPPRIGYIMVPWINAESGKAYCPNQENYNSSTPVFKILKELVGVDTEAIYLAKKEPEVFEDDQGNQIEAPDDIKIIREGLLNKIWFYIDNEKKIFGDANSATKKTMMYHWPADTTDPTIKKSHQRTYTVRSVEFLSSDIDGNTGIPTSVRPSDKRFGCVPKTSI